MPGTFIISLDFELHWGVFDKRNRQERMACYRSMQWVVPRMLQLFDQYEIGATWATVGSLFLGSESEWRLCAPQKLPQYNDPRFSSYEYVKQFGVAEDFALAHFASDLVLLIGSSPRQELATHTFSHYYCLEKGQSLEQFAADLATAQQVAIAKTGKALTSLVFPRNQYSDEYLEVCAEHGITAVRTNPSNWFWTAIGNDDTSMVRRFFRTGDVFFPMGTKSTYPLPGVSSSGSRLPVRIPASRLLRQYVPSFPLLNKIRLRRIMAEMEFAAANNECFHLWWHPETFGFHPGESLLELETILQHFHILHQKYEFGNKTMAEVANLCTT